MGHRGDLADEILQLNTQAKPANPVKNGQKPKEIA
jgi:hypothetical protein